MSTIDYLRIFTLLLLGILLFAATVHVIFFQHLNQGHLDLSSSEPIFEHIDNKTVLPGETVEFSVVAYDPNGALLQYWADIPKGAVFDKESNLFSWKPTTDQGGYYWAVFHASNGQMITNETVVIYVKKLPPVIFPIGNFTVYDGQLLEFTVNASNPYQDNLNVSVQFLPTDTTPDNATFDQRSRTFRWIPHSGQEGYYALLIAATNGGDYAIARSMIQVKSPFNNVSYWLQELEWTLPMVIRLGPSPVLHVETSDNRVHRVTRNDSINSAILDAQQGDVILVENGTYHENVLIDKAVTLVGIENPTIDAAHIGSPVSITTDGATFEGFTLVDSGSCSYCAGLKISSNLNTIRNCTIRDNRVGLLFVPPVWNNSVLFNSIYNNSGDGLSLSNTHDSTIQGNVIINNGGSGISIEDSSFILLWGNDVEFNGLSGVTTTSAYRNNITGNILRWNKNNGLSIQSGTESQVLNNQVEFNNGSGIILQDSRDDTLLGDRMTIFDSTNLLSSNHVQSNVGSGIFLSQMTAIVINNTLIGNIEGAYILESSVAFMENRGEKNGIGIQFLNSDNCSISDNQMNGNYVGINIDGYSSNNEIRGNSATNNSGTGIVLSPWTKNNILSDNTFFFNLNNLLDKGSNDRRTNIY